jgi:hypothetical protein
MTFRLIAPIPTTGRWQALSFKSTHRTVLGVNGDREFAGISQNGAFIFMGMR